MLIVLEVSILVMLRQSARACAGRRGLAPPLRHQNVLRLAQVLCSCVGHAPLLRWPDRGSCGWVKGSIVSFEDVWILREGLTSRKKGKSLRKAEKILMTSGEGGEFTMKKRQLVLQFALLTLLNSFNFGTAISKDRCLLWLLRRGLIASPKPFSSLLILRTTLRLEMPLLTSPCIQCGCLPPYAVWCGHETNMPHVPPPSLIIEKWVYKSRFWPFLALRISDTQSRIEFLQHHACLHHCCSRGPMRPFRYIVEHTRGAKCSQKDWKAS